MVCSECIGEEYLNAEIRESGTVTKCNYCNELNHSAIPLHELAERIHEVLQEHYYRTSSEPEGIDLLAAREGNWVQPGESVLHVIMNIIDSSEELAESIYEYLSNTYDAWGKDALCEPQPYDSEAYYAERPINTYDFQEHWSSFKSDVYKRARFFNRNAEDSLDHIFNGIWELKTHYNKPVIRTLTTEDCIFRVRIADSPKKLEKIIKELPDSLGAPLARYAKAGRMNAEGISMFYGAMDKQTCIAEVRSPVGSSVIIGRFYPLRDLRLLDLSRLKDVYLSGSIFDKNHIEALSRLRFLELLVDEISMPIMPGTESRDYLPTQIVSEYLASKSGLKLDGVMYSSSQIFQEHEDTDNEKSENCNKEGMNIVLFPHASVQKPYEVPDGTTISVHTNFGPPDDPDDSIYISEEYPESKIKKNKLKRKEIFDTFIGCKPIVLDDEFPDYDPRLQLDMNSIEVETIKGVKYLSNTRYVSRHRYNKKDDGF